MKAGHDLLDREDLTMNKISSAGLRAVLYTAPA